MSKRMRPKQAANYIWCDIHGEVHRRQHNYYSDNEDCKPANWRPVYVATDDPTEEF